MHPETRYTILKIQRLLESNESIKSFDQYYQKQSEKEKADLLYTINQLSNYSTTLFGQEVYLKHSWQNVPTFDQMVTEMALIKLSITLQNDYDKCYNMTLEEKENYYSK